MPILKPEILLRLLWYIIYNLVYQRLYGDKTELGEMVSLFELHINGRVIGLEERNFVS
jgi:hypothetical protein